MARPHLRIVERDDAPLDYVRFVPSPTPPTFGEKLVASARKHGETATFHFALFTIALVVGALVAGFLGMSS